jgi:hypothetical protein
MQTYSQTPADVMRPASRIDFADRLLGAEAPAHLYRNPLMENVSP